MEEDRECGEGGNSITKVVGIYANYINFWAPSASLDLCKSKWGFSYAKHDNP